MFTPPQPAIALADWARQRFGTRLLSARLFGSRARGDATEDSDIDVLLVVEELSSEEAREVAHQCGELLTRYDVVVSPFAVSNARFRELLARERRIALEIEREGISL